MTMKNHLILVATALFLILISCHKDKGVATPEIYNTWEVKSFMSLESVSYTKDPNNKIMLFFDQKGTYSLVLDVNHCGGNVTVSDNNQIQISAPGCTEICCDSDFSQKLAAELSAVTSYSITGQTLQLVVPGWGYISCELVIR